MNTPFKKTLLTLSLCCMTAMAFHTIASHITRAPIVDVYKTNQVTAAQINKKFANQFQEAQNIQLSSDSTSLLNQEKLRVVLDNLNAGIKKMGDFSYVHVSTIRYSGANRIYATVDIVDQKDAKRLDAFTLPPTNSLPDPDHLISLWQEYEKTAINIFLKEKTFRTAKSCPAYHCLFGFEQAELKKYLPIFENKVPQNKNQLIAILRQDKDSEKRAAAAYLVAHLKNGEDIIKILTPSMFDPDSGVRNNVMRTLGMTLSHLQNPDFPIEKAVTALHFPSETDRNKSLYIISNLVTQPRYAQYIKQHAKQELMDNLKMSQLNLHDTAYEILVRMSGKKFDSRNYTAWEKWLKTS